MGAGADKRKERDERARGTGESGRKGARKRSRWLELRVQRVWGRESEGGRRERERGRQLLKFRVQGPGFRSGPATVMTASRERSTMSLPKQLVYLVPTQLQAMPHPRVSGNRGDAVREGGGRRREVEGGKERGVGAERGGREGESSGSTGERSPHGEGG